VKCFFLSMAAIILIKLVVLVDDDFLFIVFVYMLISVI
jgi:hypothetical protein